MPSKARFVALGTVMLLAVILGCGAGDKAGSTTPGSSAAVSDSLTNLKKIGLAMQEFASSYNNAFPSAASVKDGKPYCSWRVKLLPYLGESALYKQYHMNEPWDSPNNLEV